MEEYIQINYLKNEINRQIDICKFRSTSWKEENINVNEINYFHIYRNAYLYCYN